MKQPKPANAASTGASKVENDSGATGAHKTDPQNAESAPQLKGRTAAAANKTGTLTTTKTDGEALSKNGSALPQTAPSKNGAQKPAAARGAAGKQEEAKQIVANAIELLKNDHRTVEALFKSFESAKAANAKEDLARQICLELIIHAHLEEDLFYAACREHGVEDDALDEAQVEHDGAKVMIAELLAGSAEDDYFDAKVKVLSEYIKHHVNEEEKADGIFAKARQASLDLKGLGAEMKTLKDQLKAEGEALAEVPLESPSLHLQENLGPYQEDTDMPRQSNQYDDQDDNRSSRSGYGGRGGNSGRGRERDEEGRFMSDDNDNGSSRGRSSRSRYDSDDDDDDRGYQTRGSNGGGRGRSNMDRDDQGRFMSDEDEEDNGRSSRGSNRGGGMSSRGRQDMDRDDQGRFLSNDDDDNRSGRGGNRGGRGMSSRGRSDMDRDEQGRFTSDDEDEDERSSRGGNRGGNPGGRNMSSRGGQDDDEDDNDRSGRSGNRGGHGRGWFGDSEGHAEAARQRSSSNRGGRGRDDDDDDDDGRSRGRSSGGQSSGGRSSGGRSSGGSSRSQSAQSSRSSSSRSSQSDEGHGGWFGDSRGHAEAARRGWANRD